jgi:hypothetical protein
VGQLFRDGDMDKAQDLLEKGREASIAVRDVNAKFARQIEGMLPADKQAAWKDAVRRASFPQIYRPSQASRALEAAAGFSDLDDSQRTSLAALQATYSRDSASVNSRLAEEQQKAEETMTIGQIMRRGRGGGGGQDEGPMGDLRRERRDLDRTTLESLKKILKPEQVERLPSNDDRGGQGRQNDGGQGAQGGGRRQQGGQGGDRPAGRRGGGIG